MNWISVKDSMPNVGDKVSIYGNLHAFRDEGYSNITHQHDVIYYGFISNIENEPPRHWFGGWYVDDIHECVTHWIKLFPIDNK